MAPPIFPNAFAQGSEIAKMNMQAAVGMNKSTLGLQSNAISGRAKMADKEEGDTATYHFVDNRNNSIAQIARICVGMMPKIYTEAQIAKLMGHDGNMSTMQLDPSLAASHKKEKGKISAINLGVGRYDVRFTAGPSYTTQRMENADKFDALLRSAPMLAPALAPMLIKMGDTPDSERVVKMVLALSPPEVQKAYHDGEGQGKDDQIPQQVKMQMEQMQQQMQKMSDMLDAAEKHVNELEAANYEKQQKSQADLIKAQTDAQIAQARLQLDMQSNQVEAQKVQIEGMRAETERAKVEGELQIQAMVAMQPKIETAPPAPTEHNEPEVTKVQIVMPDTETATQNTSAMMAMLAEMRQRMEQSNCEFQENMQTILRASTAPKKIIFQRDESGQIASPIVASSEHING
jgi:Mg2+ and Co2+ transporter CorA